MQNGNCEIMIMSIFCFPTFQNKRISRARHLRFFHVVFVSAPRCLDLDRTRLATMLLKQFFRGFKHYQNLGLTLRGQQDSEFLSKNCTASSTKACSKMFLLLQDGPLVVINGSYGAPINGLINTSLELYPQDFWWKGGKVVFFARPSWIPWSCLKVHGPGR